VTNYLFFRLHSLLGLDVSPNPNPNRDVFYSACLSRSIKCHAQHHTPMSRRSGSMYLNHLEACAAHVPVPCNPNPNPPC